MKIRKQSLIGKNQKKTFQKEAVIKNHEKKPKKKPITLNT